MSVSKIYISSLYVVNENILSIYLMVVLSPIFVTGVLHFGVLKVLICWYQVFEPVFIATSPYKLLYILSIVIIFVVIHDYNVLVLNMCHLLL